MIFLAIVLNKQSTQSLPYHEKRQIKTQQYKFIIKEYIIQESNFRSLKGNQEFLRIFSSIKLFKFAGGSFQLCQYLNTNLLQLIINYVSKRENNECKYKIFSIIHINFKLRMKGKKNQFK
ncbi:unnamed protein product [Paramecium octaurelia]|uniref:Uncharacterized protein n=1 Tax=Paramecium octaurelia TaxID=43137 RepID=A0A8S1WSF4_PAROT|nr:unnamed protein product [Paramecium octaurelia]